MDKLLVTIGRSVGGVVGALYQAGRDAINQVMVNIIPFMAFISLVIGIILYTGIGQWIAETIAPLAGSLGGMLVLSVIAQVVGTLLGSTLIANGSIPPQYALPALFAINPQVGCDFIPVGLALGEAEPETVEVGVPAVLISRLITGPISVVLAYLASLGLYA
jgi:glucitol/sorbitol PTS system EIIB component